MNWSIHSHIYVLMGTSVEFQPSDRSHCFSLRSHQFPHKSGLPQSFKYIPEIALQKGHPPLPGTMIPIKYALFIVILHQFHHFNEVHAANTKITSCRLHPNSPSLTLSCSSNSSVDLTSAIRINATIKCARHRETVLF